MVVDQEVLLGLRDSSIQATHQRKTKVTLRCTVVATITTTIITDYLETLRRRNHFTKCLCSRCTILTSGLATILLSKQRWSIAQGCLVSVYFSVSVYTCLLQIRLSFLTLSSSSSYASYFLFTSALVLDK